MQHIAQGGKFKYKRNDDLTFLLHKADLLEGLAAVLHIAEEVVGTPCSPQSSDERAPDHRFFKFLNHFFILICVNVVVQN